MNSGDYFVGKDTVSKVFPVTLMMVLILYMVTISGKGIRMRHV